MAQIQYQNSAENPENSVILDEEGFLIDPSDWTPSFTERRAREANIQLDNKHWYLIEIIRDKYLRLGALPPMRTICKAAGFDKEELKQKFGSCLKLWKLAGLPNPGEEAIAYMN